MKDMLLLLQSSDAQKAALQAFAADVQNPSSPDYQKFLSPAEFGALYGPAPSDIQTLTDWLTSQGFSVEAVATAHTWIRFSGTAGLVEHAFGTEIHSYEENGVQRVCNSTEPSIPRALAPVVSSILSLNNFEKRSFHTPALPVIRNAAGKLVAAPRSTPPAPVSSLDGSLVPAFTSQSQPEENFLAPGDFAKIYDTSSAVSAGNNGAGVSIAIVGRSDISLSDVESFRTLFKLPYNDPVFINANADPGVVPGDDEEAILDVEWSGAVAPMAQIKYVIGGTTATTDGVAISSAYIVDNKVAPIMSVSFGECEQLLPTSELQFYNNLWQQASAEGISVMVSAGDNGASGCLSQDYFFATNLGFGVSGLASTPYNTAVGGTEFNDPTPGSYWSSTTNTDQSSALGYIPEYVWNETCNINVASTIFNCYFQQAQSAPAYAGSGGQSICSMHNDTRNPVSGLYTCASGYAKPSWQAGKGVPADGKRDIPDVALAAAGGHDGFLLCYDGSCQYTVNADGSFSLLSASVIGGTSASSPSMAGLLALVEQKNGQYQGLANYKLYALANAQTGACYSSLQTNPALPSSCVFHDITQGSNTMTCNGTASGCTVPIAGSTNFEQLSGWAAGMGYDLASGLGSLDAANLVSGWAKTSQVATTTSLALSSSTFPHGSPVKVMSVVTPSSGTGVPSGSLVLLATGNTSSPGPVAANELSAGGYTGSVNSFPGGTYAVTAKYGGDAGDTGSTSVPVNVTVSPEASAISVSTLAPSKFFLLGKQPLVAATQTGLNSNWYISLSVAGASGMGVPTGTVTIMQGTSSLGTFPLDDTGSIYVACGPYTTCDYAPGSYTFTAVYTGDSSFNTVTKPFPFAIVKGSADLGVATDQSRVTQGTLVTATVYVGYDPAVLPTGTITLIRSDNNALLGTGTISASGNAVIAFNAPVGTYGADATWTGDKNYTFNYTSVYPIMTVTAPAGIVTTSSLTASAASSSVGQRTSFSVTVTPASKASNGAVPTGTVTLYSSQQGQIASPVSLVGGSTTLFVQWPVAGPESVFADYSGDSNYAASNTTASTVTVSLATPALTLSALAPYVATGAQDSITGTLVSPLFNSSIALPTGTIQFFDAVNGGPTVSLGKAQAVNIGNGSALLATLAPVLASGTHTITAVYSGDGNWVPASSTGALQIVSTNPDFTVSAPSSVTITAGQSAILPLVTSSILGFATPATISCTGSLPQGLTCGSTTITPGSNGSLALTSVAPGTVNAAWNNPNAVHLWSIQAAVELAGLLLLLMPRRRRISPLAILLLMGSTVIFATSGCSGNGASSGATTVTPSYLSVTSANTKVASGTVVTLSAEVSGGANPTGIITFYDAGVSIGTRSLTSGMGTLPTSALTVGTHAITASYSGDTNNSASKSSDVLNQTITGAFNLTIAATAGAATHTIVVPAMLE